MRPYFIFQEHKLLLFSLYSQKKATAIKQQLSCQKTLVLTERMFGQKPRTKFSLNQKTEVIKNGEIKGENIKTVAGATKPLAKTNFLPKHSSNSKNSYTNVLKKEHSAEYCDRASFPGFFAYSRQTALATLQFSKSAQSSMIFCHNLFSQDFTKVSRFKYQAGVNRTNRKSHEKIKTLRNPFLRHSNTNLNLDLALLNGTNSINRSDITYNKLLLLKQFADQEERSSFKESVAQIVISFSSFELKDLNHASNLLQIFLINLTNKFTAYNYFDRDVITFLRRTPNYSLISQQNYTFTKPRNKASIVGLLRLVRTLNESSKVTDVPLSTQLYTVIRSPHVFKKTREQFAVTRYKRTLKLDFKSIAALRLLQNSLILLKLPVETKITIKHF